MSRILLGLLVLLLPCGVLAAVHYDWFSFEDRVFYQTGEHPLDVVVVDINMDGYQDALTANRNGKSISIFGGNGDGSFEDLTPLASDLAPSSLAVGDMDGNGSLDIVAGLCGPMCQENYVGVFSGKGDGQFDHTSVIGVSGVPYNITLGDFNEDSFLDIAFSDYPGARIGLLLSRGDGSFVESSLPAQSKTIALVAGDLNHDSKLDLVTSNHGAGTSSVYLALAAGQFGDEIVVPTGELPYAIALSDVNGDEHLDLLVAHSTDPGAISIFAGRGDGKFEKYQGIKAEDRLVFIETADFDRDGSPDIIVTRNQQTRASVYINRGDGTFADSSIEIPAENKIYSLAVSDLNGDRFPDLVTVDYEQHNLAVALGAEPNAGQ